MYSPKGIDFEYFSFIGASLYAVVQYISMSFIDTYLYTFNSLSLFNLDGLNIIGFVSVKKLGKFSKSNPITFNFSFISSLVANFYFLLVTFELSIS